MLGGSVTACNGIQPGWGVAFVLAAPTSQGGAWTYTVLYRFNGGSDGGSPSALTLGPNGTVYGTTFGSATAPDGAVFAYQP